MVSSVDFGQDYVPNGAIRLRDRAEQSKHGANGNVLGYSYSVLKSESRKESNNITCASPPRYRISITLDVKPLLDPTCTCSSSLILRLVFLSLREIPFARYYLKNVMEAKHSGSRCRISGNDVGPSRGRAAETEEAYHSRSLRSRLWGFCHAFDMGRGR